MWIGERDALLGDMRGAGFVSIKWIDGFQSEREGRNGGGDRFVTDGRLAVVEPVGVPPSQR